MADASNVAGHLEWQSARIEAIERLSPLVRRVVLRPTVWHRPLAGQNLSIRLTADDGYQSPAKLFPLVTTRHGGLVRVGHRASFGRVSPWFHDAAQVGDSIEILGPVGLHFVWRPEDEQPALLIGSGSGVVPLLAMAAHHVHSRSTSPMVLVIAVAYDGRCDAVAQSCSAGRSMAKASTAGWPFRRDITAPRNQDRIGRLSRFASLRSNDWVTVQPPPRRCSRVR